LVDPLEVKKSLRPNTVLVSVMYAANEIGTVEPIEAIGKITKQAGVLLHTDAAAAAEYLNLDVEKLGVDLMVLGPHKFGGPKGVGILYVREGVKITPLVYGGAQEKGLRPGTHNVPGIVGAAKALELAVAEREANVKGVGDLAARLIAGLSKVPDSYLTGHPQKRVPHIVSFIFRGAEGEAMVLKLSDRGIMVSSGSACTSGSLEPSHVLLACGIPPQEAHGSARFSLSNQNTKEEVDYVINAMLEIVGELRRINPLWSNTLKN
ncbi:MAG: cysteine desulfurase family protein, partial [bacterium]